MTLQVRLRPGASKDELLGFRDGVLQARVTAPPIEGAELEAVRQHCANDPAHLVGRHEWKRLGTSLFTADRVARPAPKFRPREPLFTVTVIDQ